MHQVRGLGEPTRVLPYLLAILAARANAPSACHRGGTLSRTQMNSSHSHASRTKPF
jgi:hypothetical protein